jgi:hypothetical protein
VKRLRGTKKGAKAAKAVKAAKDVFGGGRMKRVRKAPSKYTPAYF